MRTILACLLWTGVLASAVASAAEPARVHLRLKTSSPTAICGIPVVVELQLANRTANPLTTYDLSDPYLTLVSWEWWSGPGGYHKVALAEYHYAAVPDPAPPQALVTHPRRRRSFSFTVPTPPECAPGQQWWLIASVRNPADQSITRAEAVFQTRAMGVNALGESFDAGVVQAAMLEHARTDVLRRSFGRAKRSEVSSAVQKGDVAAAVVAFSNALQEQSAIEEDWKRLDAAPAEVKILRNYLLLSEVRRLHRLKQPVPAAYAALVADLRESDPFRAKLRAAIPPQ